MARAGLKSSKYLLNSDLQKKWPIWNRETRFFILTLMDVIRIVEPPWYHMQG